MSEEFEEDAFDMEINPWPLLPYKGSSGHSGTDSSENRANTRDLNGDTAMLQFTIYNNIRLSQGNGRTVGELKHFGHHGNVSGALSNLHKKKAISRLKEKRGKQKIYVCNQYVDGRETESQGRQNDSNNSSNGSTDSNAVHE
jgi:hypothetical protein